MVIQALILSHLDYRPAVWSSVTMDKIKKLQMVQNRAGCIPLLHCEYRTNVVAVHNCLAWLYVKNRLLYSLLVFIRNISVAKTVFILYKNSSFSLGRHNYPTCNRRKFYNTENKNKLNQTNGYVLSYA